MHTALKKRQSRQVIVKPSLHFTTAFATFARFALTVFANLALKPGIAIPS